MKIKQRIQEWWHSQSDKKSQSYWRRMMASTQEKLSRGAANIMKLIPSAHKDNWRRKDK